MTRDPSTPQKVTSDRRFFWEAARARWLRPVPEALRRFADHLSATRTLLEAGDGDLAPGAANVAAVVALRSAAVASMSHAEFVGNWHALGAVARAVPTSVRERFARLCEAARRVEVERRVADSLSVEPSGLTPGPPSARAVRRVDPAAADLYADVLWMSGHLGRVLSLLADVKADADEIDRRGLASTREGVDAHRDPL